MEEKKKTNKGFIAVIIILVLLLVGSIGFIVYDKLLVTDSVSSEKSDVKDDNKSDVKDSKEKELDINSRLVQSLYNKVTIKNSDWLYYDKNTNFNVNSDGVERIKMNLVGINLNDKNHNYIDCTDNNGIPANSSDGYFSVCSANKQWQASDLQSGYSRSYIESVYKDLFGSDVKLDKTQPIYIGQFSCEAYHYVESLDQYVRYLAECGGATCNQITTKLTKAVKNSNEIKIYESFEDIGCGSEDPKKNYTYVYTFELDEDGMYNFVSRVAEK